MAKFATNVSVAMLLPSLIQVTESISGSVVPLAMFLQSGFSNVSSIGLPEQTHSHIGCISMIFVCCVLSSVSSEQLDE